MKAPLVPVAVAFLLGILGLLSAGVVLGGRRRAKTRRVALLALWLCLGALRMAAWQAHPDVWLRDVLRDEPQAVQVHGVVPRTIRREQDSRLRELSERTGRSLSEVVREAVDQTEP